MEFKDFKNNIVKANTHKVFTVTNSYGIRQAWRYLVKDKKIDQSTISEHKFNEVIKEMHKAFVEYILKGHDIKLPHGMGTLEIRKTVHSPRYKGNKLINPYPIDWNNTLKLWYQDKEAFENKILIRLENKTVFRILYNKKNAQYKNQVYYKFTPARSFKLLLKKQALDNNIDSPLIYKQ